MLTSRFARTIRVVKVLSFVGLGLLAATLGAIILAPSAGYSTVVVQGRSMGSSPPVGSLALMEAVDADGVAVRDVVMVRREASSDAMPVLHRVIDVDHVGDDVVIITKGDANPAPDPSPHVLGESVPRMRMAIPHIGRYLSLLTTPLGWVLGVVGPAATLTAWTLLRLWAPHVGGAGLPVHAAEAS